MSSSELPVQERHGKSSVNGQKDAEGIGASLLSAETERSGTVQPGDLTNEYKSLKGGCAKRLQEKKLSFRIST